jgi:hypothetical protein
MAAKTLYFIQQYLNIKVIVQVKLIWCYFSHSGCHCLTESIIPESNSGAQVWQYLQQSLRDIGSSFAATSMPIREMDGHTYFETNN